MNTTNAAAGAGAETPKDLLWFCALVCGLTWLVDFPMAWAFAQHRQPSSGALSATALGALLPTLVALGLSWRRGQPGKPFGPWRTPLFALVGALFVPALLHLPATVFETLLGGHVAQWFYPPTKPEHVVSLVIFSVGEEFGWRGYAYPRFVARYGLVVGNLLLGCVWGAWHLMMLVSPETGQIDAFALLELMVMLPLLCLPIAWCFERSHRSMAVAIALHMGLHLDNVARAPSEELRLRVLRLVVLGVVAVVAGNALRRRSREETPAHPVGTN